MFLSRTLQCVRSLGHVSHRGIIVFVESFTTSGSRQDQIWKNLGVDLAKGQDHLTRIISLAIALAMVQKDINCCPNHTELLLLP
jgi:hypothetical protein